VEQRLRDLEDTIASFSGAERPARPPPLAPAFQTPQRPPERESDLEDADQEPPRAWQVLVDSSLGPNAAPASYVAAVSSEPSPASGSSHSKEDADFITKGLVKQDTAERLFEIYRSRLDHFLYCIIDDYTTLQSARKSSTTLASAICVVAALHSRSGDYQTCHREYRRRVSLQFFSRSHSLDEVRGLCIGAFWLSDMSWALVGAAVRIAIEINLHRCFVSPDLYSREWHRSARVFLLVYVCDHHFSVVYGRPPMTRELDINAARSLLDSQYATEDDHRLFSQVDLWANNYRTYKTFGINNEAALTDSCLSDFRRLSIALDTWRADWEEKFRFNAHVGNYPAKGVALHYHFAKLYLCSHAFRNFSTSSRVSPATRTGVEEFASMAINSAISILRGIVVDEEIQSYLNGLPTYFDTMIAFAVVFLLKLVSSPTPHPNLDKPGIMVLLDQISIALANVTANMRPQHLLSGISASVKKLIAKARQKTNTATNASIPQTADISLPPPAVPTLSQIPVDTSVSNWMLSPDDNMFIGNFDFMGSTQDLVDFNFMDFEEYSQSAS
jgi:hypothetical protein